MMGRIGITAVAVGMRYFGEGAFISGDWDECRGGGQFVAVFGENDRLRGRDEFEIFREVAFTFSVCFFACLWRWSGGGDPAV